MHIPGNNAYPGPGYHQYAYYQCALKKRAVDSLDDQPKLLRSQDPQPRVLLKEACFAAATEQAKEVGSPASERP